MQITNDDNFTKVDTEEKEIPDFDNVVGLFNLLLKIDKRVNPHLYKSDNEKSNINIEI